LTKSHGKGVELLSKPASIIVLTLLVVSALALAYDVQPVKSDYAWTQTVYINADGSISPSTVPISTLDNVTYTLTDNIAGNITDSAIIIQRDNIIVDGAGHALQGTLLDSTGIELKERSNVTIKNMKISAFDCGIYLGSSSNSIVSGNNLTDDWEGIWLNSSSKNNVSENSITNTFYGLYLSSCSNNSIAGNNITANNGYGIYLYASSDNTIYHNNFLSNTRQAYSQGSTNVWDDGYPSGGNYWSDYNGTDVFRGSYQNQTGSDGIGDTPYPIDANNQDHYPLMNSWTAPAHAPSGFQIEPIYLYILAALAIIAVGAAAFIMRKKVISRRSQKHTS
jgi:parallel beta-helix repeat protein